MSETTSQGHEDKFSNKSDPWSFLGSPVKAVMK